MVVFASSLQDIGACVCVCVWCGTCLGRTVIFYDALYKVDSNTEEGWVLRNIYTM